MLEHFHYLHLPFDADLSSKFLDNYINWFDPQHIHFLKADLDDFEQYRTRLAEYTKVQRDTSPAYVIFNRFMERFEQSSAYSKEMLHSRYLEFTNEERISLNRKTAPFPADIEEAQKLWSERIRYEYLDEMLNEESPAALAAMFAKRHNPIEIALIPHDIRNSVIKFVETRINRNLRYYREWDSDRVLEKYLTELSLVYDPHSEYQAKDTFDNFRIQMSLSLFGIGAVLSTDDEGYCKIMSLSPGMPAAKSKKLKTGDRIVRVAQGGGDPVDVVEMPLNKVVELIRGPKGTEVRLTIIPADSTDSSKRVLVSLIRDEIKLDEQQAKAKIVEKTDADGHTLRLGVIDLPSFYASFDAGAPGGHREPKSCTADIEKLLEKLKSEKVDGVILDLRHNGGGVLGEAIALTGLFIKEGPVVMVRNIEGMVQVHSDNDPRVVYDGPLVVATSRFSASASEIVAGALQDYGRAVITGSQSTHGKGTVQTMIPLAQYLYMKGEFFTSNPAGLGEIKFTTNAFYRVTGSSTQLRGVIPDIHLPSSYDYLETEEGSEPYALKLPDIQPTQYGKLGMVEPYLTTLAKRSAARVKDSKDFDYVREDIELVKKQQAEKSMSLNLHQRLVDGEKNEARRKLRDAEYKLRPLQQGRTFDLTLKNGAVEMTEAKKPGSNTNLVVKADSKADSTNKIATVIPASVAAGTNTVKKPGAEDEALAEDPSKSPAVDPVPSPEEKAPADETENILVDYIALMRNSQAVTAVIQETPGVHPTKLN
jgi:carboxyl-terminal processing protease